MLSTYNRETTKTMRMRMKSICHRRNYKGTDSTRPCPPDGTLAPPRSAPRPRTEWPGEDHWWLRNLEEHAQVSHHRRTSREAGSESLLDRTCSGNRGDRHHGRRTPSAPTSKETLWKKENYVLICDDHDLTRKSMQSHLTCRHCLAYRPSYMGNRCYWCTGRTCGCSYCRRRHRRHSRSSWDIGRRRCPWSRHRANSLRCPRTGRTPRGLHWNRAVGINRGVAWMKSLKWSQRLCGFKARARKVLASERTGFEKCTFNLGQILSKFFVIVNFCTCVETWSEWKWVNSRTSTQKVDKSA